jgi:hypothetical protein
MALLSADGLPDPALLLSATVQSTAATAPAMSIFFIVSPEFGRC